MQRPPVLGSCTVSCTHRYGLTGKSQACASRAPNNRALNHDLWQVQAGAESQHQILLPSPGIVEACCALLTIVGSCIDVPGNTRRMQRYMARLITVVGLLAWVPACASSAR